MNVGQYCEIDGSIELEELEISIGIKAELILIAVNPAFDQNKKRIFLVTEKIFPGGQTRISVAARGGHTFKVPTPPGHYQLGEESLVQLSPLLHNTSAIKAITESGFLLQQARTGGSNICTVSKASLYRPTATHVIEMDTEKYIEKGIFFFGNLFTDVVYCTGAWKNSDWNGKVPLECLRISCKE